MTLDPPRRSYSEAPRKGPRDVDAAGRAQKIRALGFALYAGLPAGLGTGLLVGHPIVGLLLGPSLVWLVVVGVASLAGRGASALYMPSGASTPRKKGYSRAEALAVRGEYQAAMNEYEAAIAADPCDPEPYLRVARILRDGLKRPADAAFWFRRARREAHLSQGQEIRTLREAAEIYLHHLQEPRKAAPELARLAEAFPETPDGRWASEELARVKEEMGRVE